MKHGEAALLVPPNDSNAMAAAICTLMENEELRYKIGCQAQKDACKRFTKENFIKNIIEICDQWSNE